MSSNTNSEFIIGSLLNERFLITAELGRGGQALVLKAADTKNHNNPVAIKTLRSDVNNQWSIDKFDQERRALAELQEVNGIVKLIDNFTTANGRNYTVLEYVGGSSLTSLIDDLPKNLQRASRLFWQIAIAVDAAHRKDIFHRDLKPDNILVADPNTRDESVKIIDFGIAKQPIDPLANIQPTITPVGTPYFLSPNALDGRPDPRLDDIYALGMTGYAMTTGQLPISEIDTPLVRLRETQKEIQRYPPSKKNGSLTTEVDKVILKALAENPNERYEPAKLLGEELTRALLLPMEATTVPIEPLDFRKRSGALYPILFSLMALASALAVWMMFPARWVSDFSSGWASLTSSQVVNANIDNSNNGKSINPSSSLDPPTTLSRASASASEGGQEDAGVTVDVIKQGSSSEGISTTTTDTFRSGEAVRLNILSKNSGVLQIFLKNNSGKVQKVPSAKIYAGRPILFPSPGWLFFDKKPGTETIYIVISKQTTPNKIDLKSLDDQSAGGRIEFMTAEGYAVKIIKLSHVD